ncbi:MAG: DUF1345 domain-containing protein, partial [Microcystaceae cyanobacterium]
LLIPISIKTRVVMAFIGALLTGIFFLSRKMARFSPWQLIQFSSPNSKVAFTESLLYTIGSFGLLIYLAYSEHIVLHFALGFFGIVCAWLLIQLIYSQQYALRYYHDGGRGLVFPDCEQPNWTEFLYEGFCMAACYQTSDTSVTSTKMRQLIAAHGILSYLLSVSIIAMMFGLVGNLL